MNTEPRLVACPACGRAHPGHSGTTEPHYCSIGCYRAGRGLDDPVTGDGRRWCTGCQRYLQPGDKRRFCSDACRVADWRRRQPQRPPSPPDQRRAANIDAMTLDQVMTEHAPARYTDHTSATIVDDAVFSLATVRGLQAVGDAGAALHALASLATQIDQLLPATITDARDQDYTWSEIAALLAVSRDRAQRLAARHQPPRRVPIAD
jgi:hypothetical protein